MKNTILFLIILMIGSCSANKSMPKSAASGKMSYTLDLTDLEDDKLKVKITLTGMTEKADTFCFPRIVPGIYGAMDFGQYIDGMLVKDKSGKVIESKKIDANCWTISQPNSVYTIEYNVADTWEDFDLEMKRGFYKSAASSFKKDVFIINPNCLFGYFRGQANLPIDLTIRKPENLYGATSLNKISSSPSIDTFKAKDYHELVDNPMMYAIPDTTHIHLSNIDIEVACYSTSQKNISAEISEHIRPLVVNQSKYLSGNLPVDKYTFILYHNLNPDPNSWVGDGLEHSQSTLILLYMPMDMETIKDNVYGIASHEFFHTLMPLGIHSHEIANYDFNQPKMSRHLWLYEGMTEYFTIHMPIKSGLQEMSEFIDVLERKLSQMQNFDNTISFTELSLNAMELQDQYYNVYLKGTLINLCFDIKLRELSNGAYGVQNLVLDLMNKYGKDKSFEDENLFDEIIEITKFPELNAFFEDYIIGAKSIPLDESLRKVGYKLEGDIILALENPTEKQIALRKSWINR